jgi:hypothetical protein
LRPSYCTFASTVEFVLSVNVHVLALAPLLEHAPDQMASRPLETVSVILLPAANGAVDVLPTVA